MNTTSIRIPTEAAHRLKMLALPGQSMAGVLAEILPEALDRAEAGRKAMRTPASAQSARHHVGPPARRPEPR